MHSVPQFFQHPHEVKKINIVDSNIMEFEVYSKSAVTLKEELTSELEDRVRQDDCNTTGEPVCHLLIVVCDL
jgi:hypothetical protein